MNDEVRKAVERLRATRGTDDATFHRVYGHGIRARELLNEDMMLVVEAYLDESDLLERVKAMEQRIDMIYKLLTEPTIIASGGPPGDDYQITIADSPRPE